MADKKIKIEKIAIERFPLPIRSALIPNFYQNFHCLMGACQDNCCDDGWNIRFDKKDYLRVKRATEKDPELREMAAQGMRRLRDRANDTMFNDKMYAEFCITDEGRCAFHSKEGLCRLQLACGESTLPLVCRQYPRQFCYTPAAKEYCLSPSCEGVLQQFWDLPDGIEFVEEPLPKAEQRDANISQNENLLYCFAPIRALCVDILQNRSMPLSRRMLCLGIVLQRLQQADWTDFDPDEWTDRQWQEIASAQMNVELPGNRAMYLLQNIRTLDGIDKAWTSDIYRALKVRHKTTLTISEENGADPERTTSVEYSEAAYQDMLTKFQGAFSNREYFFENLMVAAALFMYFPDLSSREGLWKRYVTLCSLYSFYRFVSVLGCGEGATKERMFHYIVMASRATLHDRERFNSVQDDLFQHESSTLAHMAILLGWD